MWCIQGGCTCGRTACSRGDPGGSLFRNGRSGGPKALETAPEGSVFGGTGWKAEVGLEPGGGVKLLGNGSERPRRPGDRTTPSTEPHPQARNVRRPGQVTQPRRSRRLEPEVSELRASASYFPAVCFLGRPRFPFFLAAFLFLADRLVLSSPGLAPDRSSWRSLGGLPRRLPVCRLSSAKIRLSIC